MLVAVMLLVLMISTTHPQCTSRRCGEGTGCMEVDAGRTLCADKVDDIRSNVEDLRAEFSRGQEQTEDNAEELAELSGGQARLERVVEELTKSMARLEANFSMLNTQITKAAGTYRDCKDAFQNGITWSGEIKLATVFPGTFDDVYCDMTTDGGGWLVIQRRQDGSVNFTQNWATYASGFGDLEGEFWIGNRLLHILTSARPQELRIDLQAFDGSTAWAKYSHFGINDEVNKFRLNISGYTGSDNLRADSMAHSNGWPFSTIDRDSDDWSTVHCAARPDQGGGGGWWYWSCKHANLNGGQYGQDARGGGIIWAHWHGDSTPLKGSHMRIRPRT